MMTMHRFFCARAATVDSDPSCIRIEPSPSSAKTFRFGWAMRHAQRDRNGQAHAAQHVEILLTAAAGSLEAAHRSKLV